MSEIYSRMAAVMAEVNAIGKGKTNTQQGFKYRGIDDVYNALNPLLARQGLFCAPEVLSKTREERTNKNGTVLAFTCLRMRYTFWAPDGSSVSCVVEGEGMDSGDKSSNKAMAIAHKYALLQTFCIPTEDMKDPDAEVHEVAPDPRRAELIKRLEAASAKGMDAFRLLWQSLAEDEKEMVGAATFSALREKAKAAA
jgi:hypothetical protein